MFFSVYNQSGIIKWIVLIIIAILILSFLGIDIRGIVESPIAQKNIQYVWGGVLYVWNEYLADPILYFWNNIFISLFWDSFIDNLERIKRGEPHDFLLNAPEVPTVTQ